MATVELIAKRAGHYPKRVKIGDRFSVSRSDARVLIAVGAAQVAPPVVLPTVISPPAPTSRKYLRRDLRAQED